MALTPERLRHLIEAGLLPSSAEVFGRLQVDSIDLEVVAGHGLDLHELAFLIRDTELDFESAAALRINGVPDAFVRQAGKDIPQNIFRLWVQEQTGSTYPDEYIAEMYMPSLQPA